MSRRENWFHASLAVAIVLVLVAVPAFAAQGKMSDAKPSGKPVGKPVLQSLVGTHKSPGGGPVTFYTTKAAFDAAHPGLPCEDFQDFTNVLLGCDGPANSGTSCPGGYDPGEIATGLEISCTTNCTGAPGNNGLVIIPAGFDGNPTIVFGSNYFADDTIVRLTAVPAASALGLEISCHFAAPSVDVVVFDTGGTPIGNTSSACASAGTFLGMDTGLPPGTGPGIGHITITNPGGAAVESTDNVCFGDPVPVELQGFTIED
jgi:hypothetical protein